MSDPDGPADSTGPLVLGVDGGGTKTLARLMRAHPSGRLGVLGEGVSSGSNPLSVGAEASREAIAAAIRGAWETGRPHAGDAPAAAAVLSIAGCATPSVAAELQAWVDGAGLAQRARVVDDAEPLLATASPGEPVVGLIAGTGSAAVARTAAGERSLVGGWGYLIDDGGSGFEIGRAGLQRVCLRSDSGHEADRLTNAVLAHAGVEETTGLKQVVYGAESPRQAVARFAEPVLRLAAEGDPAALAIAEAAADALAELALRAVRRTSDGQRVEALLSGSLLEKSVAYRRLLTERLVAAGWSASRVRLAPDAATGCCLLAARLLDGAS